MQKHTITSCAPVIRIGSFACTALIFGITSYLIIKHIQSPEIKMLPLHAASEEMFNLPGRILLKGHGFRSSFPTHAVHTALPGYKCFVVILIKVQPKRSLTNPD